MYDFTELKVRMLRKGISQGKLAELLNKDEGTISSRFTNKSEFKPSEMEAIMQILDIDPQHIRTYFFTK